MSIEALKEQARRHEQREDWQKALDLYLEAIRTLEADEELDIGLFNRVGDLEVRLGRVDRAVQHYERAVEHYVEAELPNNAIAVCKKVVRNLPGRNSIYLRMGQIRAHQGFLTDARQNFLTYAERKQAEGDLEEAFRALIEFVELAPEDTEIRMTLAGQLAQHDRIEEAVQQFREARRRLILEGRDEEAEEVAERILELDEEAELRGAEAIRAAGAEEAVDLGGSEQDEVWGAGFSSFSRFSAERDEGASDQVEAGAGSAVSADELEDESEGVSAELDEIAVAGDEEDEEEEDASQAAAMVEPGALELDELDGFEIGGEEEAEDEIEGVAELPVMGFGSEEVEPESEEEAEEADEVEEAREAALEEAASELHRAEPEAEPAEEESEAGTGEGWLAEVEELEERPPEEEAPADRGAAQDPESLRSEGERLLDEGDEAGWEMLTRAHEAFADAGRLEEAVQVVRRMGRERPGDVPLHQRMVEYAYRTTDPDALVDAYLGLAEALQRGGDTGRARSVYQQVLDTDPDNEAARDALESLGGGERTAASAAPSEVASTEEYVDLGAMILEDEEQEKSTRFVVAAEAPTGDEAADFAKMLSQFKDKVAENVATDDVAAHYDLGTAYKEMGLLDEAISEFQAALRAARDHLPTYEMLGQCFLEKGQPEAAVRILEKALDIPWQVEDELLAIYYHLGRAHEEVGRTEQALEFYDKVFALDINFMDVTDRLRALR